MYPTPTAVDKVLKNNTLLSIQPPSGLPVRSGGVCSDFFGTDGVVTGLIYDEPKFYF